MVGYGIIFNLVPRWSPCHYFYSSAAQWNVVIVFWFFSFHFQVRKELILTTPCLKAILLYRKMQNLLLTYRRFSQRMRHLLTTCWVTTLFLTVDTFCKCCEVSGGSIWMRFEKVVDLEGARGAWGLLPVLAVTAHLLGSYFNPRTVPLVRLDFFHSELNPIRCWMQMNRSVMNEIQEDKKTRLFLNTTEESE